MPLSAILEQYDDIQFTKKKENLDLWRREAHCSNHLLKRASNKA
jgi:hypothetical protein